MDQRLAAAEIREIREAAGLNIPELAAWLGVTSQNVVLWENEHESVRPEPWVCSRLRELAAETERRQRLIG